MATASDASSVLSGSIRGLVAGVRNLGLAMTAASAIGGAAMIGLARSAEEVNSAFREVDTISDEVKSAQQEYGELISDLNTQFGLQASKLEVIDGLYQSVSAGVQEGEESQRAFLETAAQLAVVGRVDLAESVDVLSTVLNTYGLEAEDARDVSESLFQTVQFGKVRLEELAPVLGRVAALGSEMNVQIDEIGASMAVLTRTGFEARVAATGLRNIFRSMMRPSETMQQLLREIALENDEIARQWNEQSELGDNLAQTYRDTASAVRDLEAAEAAARDAVNEHSLAIQEARLKIQAIEQDRVDQLGEMKNERVAEADTVEELNSIIEDYRFQVNQSRIEEEKARIERGKKQEQLQNMREDFKEQVDIQGNLENSVGNLVLQEQDFIDTLVELRKRARDQNIAFNELFPRTRALQGALALVGEDGQLLMDIFEDMEKETFNARDAWDEMDESARDNFDSFEEFQSSIEDIQEGGLVSWMDEATGAQQEMRNATSQLHESINDLGQLFVGQTTESIANFADTVSGITDRISDMDQTVKDNIARFAMLAAILGVVIGPILFFGGQLALIATAMGTMFIPFLGITGTLLGVVASGFMKATQGGEEAEGMFASMSETLDGVMSFLSDMLMFFRGGVLPGMRAAGEAFVDLLTEIHSQFGDLQAEMGFNPFAKFAVLLGDLFFKIAEFLNNNRELIANLIVLAVDVILNKVIPALADFAAGVIAIIQDIQWEKFVPIAKMIAQLALVIVDLIGKVGRWMQENSELIGTLITWGIIIGGTIAVILKTIAIIGTLASTIATIITTVKIVIGVFALAINTFGVVGTIITTLAGLFPSLASGVSVIIAAGKVLIGVLGAIASALGLPIIVVGALIAALLLAAYFFRDEIVQIFKNAFEFLETVVKNVVAFLKGDIGFKEAGKNIVIALVEGILSQIGVLKKAAKKVASTVSDYLPFSPAEKGPLADNPPKESGKAISGGVASGISDGIPEIEGEFENMEGMAEDFNFENMDKFEDKVSAPKGIMSDPSNAPQQRRGMGGMGQKIEISDKAIYFEAGAFEGVADEELPGKVRKVIDSSMDEIVADLEAKGVEVEG